MPLTTPESYLPTMDAFLAHWDDVNAALAGPPPTPLTLAGGYLLADFQADRDALSTLLDDVAQANTHIQIACADRDQQKAAAIDLLQRFRGAVRVAAPNTKFMGNLPKNPAPRASAGPFLAPMRALVGRWTEMNAALAVTGFTPPLLVGTTTLVQATTQIGALDDALAAVETAREDARVKRNDRELALAAAKARMKQYKDAAIAALGPDHVLIASIPAISPPPGATPKPVSASGLWNAQTCQADLTWTASPNPDLDYYSVRTAPGPTYVADEETVIDQVLPPAVTFSTDVGLAAPGSVGLYRVYVVLKTGNEKGSATVKVTRPTS